MKLALIRRQFSATGGAELYLQRLLRALAARGHELHLYAEAWGELPEQVAVHRIEADGSRASRAQRFAYSVQTALIDQKFDCVFSLERTVRQDVYRAGDGLHRVWLQRRRQFAPWWKKAFIGRGAFHRAMMELESQTFDSWNTRHIIVNSEMVKREILQHFRFPENRLHLVRNGIAVEAFQRGDREQARARFGLKPEDFALLFVGSGWERKGLRYLFDTLRLIDKLRALSEVKGRPVKLLVAGRGQAPVNTPENVTFLGPLPDVENAYAAADLFTFLPIYEPSANVCFEALAAGLPVITTRFNGASEVLEEGVTGSVLYDPSDILAVAEKIIYWMSHPPPRPLPLEADLGLDRNVTETLAVLELAAQEKL
ncbi:MAG: glycosyltransferase family 4 protein [Verrucomicrobiota bacterium]